MSETPERPIEPPSDSNERMRQSYNAGTMRTRPSRAVEPPSIAGYDNVDQVRRYAEDEQRLHNPKLQANGYDRCEHCHFTRHPCDVFELASIVLALLDRVQEPARL